VKRTDAEKIADEEFALRLLAGYTGTGKIDYKLSNNQEKQARAALARLIRDQMAGLAAEHLALAIDPDTPSKFPLIWPTCKIKFEGRTKGKRSTWAREIIIANFVLERLWAKRPLPKGHGTRPRSVLDMAIDETCEKFGIERSRAYEIWNQYKNPMKPPRAQIRRNKRASGK
jgi:hypothetical protein